MKLHRFFGNFDFRKSRVVIRDAELLYQWHTVLRFQFGNELILCDGNMNEALCRITALKKDSAEVEILGVSKNEREPTLRVILYCSILKGEHFEFVAEKATELGVAEIVPVISEWTIKQSVRTERLHKIIKEAAEQSGRGIIPKLHDESPFISVIRRASANDLNFFFDSTGDDIRHFSGKKVGTVGIFIGPEGGWTEPEVNAARAARFEFTSLGKTTLRAETAAIVAVYAALNAV